MDGRSGRNELRKQRDKDDRDGRKHRSRSRSSVRTGRTLERHSRSPASEHRSSDRRHGSGRKGSESRKAQRLEDESRRRRRSKSEEGEIDDVTPERERIRSVATKPNVSTRKPNEPTASGSTNVSASKVAAERRPERGRSPEVQPQAAAQRSGMPNRTDYLEGYSRWLDSETESESEADDSEAQPTMASNDPEQQPGSGTERDDIMDASEPNGAAAGENGAELDADTGKDEIATGTKGPDVTASPEAETTVSRERTYYPALSGCRSVNEYDLLNRIEEGTYGVVYRARDKKRNETVALKRLKMEKEKEGFPITSLREINTLLKAQHENIVTVREIVVGSNMDRIYVVMDYADHDLRSLMESMRTDQRFTLGEVKSLLSQLLAAVAHLHDNWILHRDLKTSNLLLTNRGVLKVGDFGLAREYGSPLKPFTPVVVTLWYRAPELLLGAARYSTSIDVWSVGCIFAELLLFRPLWSAKSENEQLGLIFRDLGTPSERIWPDCTSLPLWSKLQFAHYPYNQLRNRFSRNLLTDSGWSLLNRLFTYDPARRITAADARRHEYFSESPLPTEPAMFRTWPSRNEAPPPAAHAALPRPQPLAAAQVLAARRVVDEVLARKKRETPPPPVAGVGAQAQLLGKDDDI